MTGGCGDAIGAAKMGVVVRRVLLLASIIVASPSVASACPFCRDALDAAFARGWNRSIYLLLALVPLAVGALAFASWRASRRERGASEVGGRPRWPSN